MKLTINADEIGVEIPIFEMDEKETGNLAVALDNFARGTAQAIRDFARQFSDDKEKEQSLVSSVIQYLQVLQGEFYGRAQGETAQPDYPFEEMEGEFITWIYGQGYDDPYAFADEHSGKQLKLDFADDGNVTEVFFSDEDGNKLDVIGEIDSYLFTDEPESAAAICLEYTCIAALCFDKLYGQDDNPVRNRPVDSLYKAITVSSGL